MISFDEYHFKSNFVIDILHVVYNLKKPITYNKKTFCTLVLAVCEKTITNYFIVHSVDQSHINSSFIYSYSYKDSISSDNFLMKYYLEINK